MNRLPVLAAIALLVMGFSLAVTDAQTERVRWETRYVGAAYSAPTPRLTDLAHCYYPGDFSSTFPGGVFWRTAGLQCSWGVAGTTDGGTNSVWVQIVHEDAGVDCACKVGSCAGAATTEMGCTCEDGGYGVPGIGVQLGRTGIEDGGWQLTRKHCVQLSSLTSCISNPAQFSCSVDLLR